MVVERDLYIGEHTERTISCTQATYDFCYKQLDALGIARGARGIDIGSNQGFGIQQESWSEHNLIASDNEIKYLKLAKQNSPDVSTAVLDGTHLALPEDTFDFVMMHQVIEHLDTKDQKKTLKEIVRVLKPEKGIAFISTPNSNSRPKWSRPYSPDHKNEMSLDEFSEILKDNFESINIFGQRFINKGLKGKAYQFARSSPLNDLYFKHLPRSLRLRVRDQLSIKQQADIVRPIAEGDIPRGLIAVCRGPKK